MLFIDVMRLCSTMERGGIVVWFKTLILCAYFGQDVVSTVFLGRDARGCGTSSNRDH